MTPLAKDNHRSVPAARAGAGCTATRGAGRNRAVEREIAALASTLSDDPLFKNLPGAGAQLAPRLPAAFGEQHDRFRTAYELQKYVTWVLPR